MSSPLQELRGTFRRLAWSAPGDGRRFCIASVDVGDDPLGSESVSVKGDADPSEFIQDLQYRFWGKWGKQNEYGRQFDFKQLKRDEPHSRIAVVGYLRQFATGIGPVYASQLWDAFGADAIRILRTDPDRAALAIGVPVSRTRDASEALNCDGQNEDLRLELVQLFDGRGFPKKLIEIVIKKWGRSAPQRIRRDPFTLLVNRLPGCGFARCDRLYVDLGLPLDRLKRQFACIWKALKDDGDGHTWHPVQVAELAVKRGVSGLTEGALNWQRAVRLGVRAGWLRMRKDNTGKWWIAEAKRADNEASVASDMRRLMKGFSNETTEENIHDPELAVDDAAVGSRHIPYWPNVEEIEGLTDHHREQLKLAFSGPVAILTGDPGTGKTTASSLVLRHLHKHYDVVACSPTNLAAMRMRTVLESFGVFDVPVSTFHKILGAMKNGHDGGGWGFFYNRLNPLPCEVLLIDEDSMRDVDISASLLESLRDGTLVLFLGDPNQLPPVGHGAPLRDGIAANIPHGHFTEILRNSGSITEFCRAARAGQRPRPPVVIDIERGHNWKHFEVSSPANQKAILSSSLKTLDSFEIDGRKIDPIRDVQIIVGLNEKGDLSRAEINKLAQSILNPFGAAVDGNPFRVGDKVICQDNCKLRRVAQDEEELESDDDDPDSKEFVSNGEMGFVLSVYKRHSVVKLDEKRIVRVPVAKGDEDSNGNFDLAYAVTFHKAQGNQWGIVFLLSDRAANRLGSRELWNTGGSRPQVLLVTIGELATIQRQCQRVALRDRKTFLKELICENSDS
jgi:exodeoxyribonuclease V alpha subunit